jgi:hypothetical protein
MRISCRKSVAEHINYDPATQISQDGVCIACHGRQNAEHNLLTDVHRAIDAANPGEMPKFSCMGCHQETEVHGDQAALDSQLDNPKTSCAQSGCHERELKIAGGKKATGGACKGDKGSKVNERCETFHLQHVVDVDCTSCHVQSNTTCNSCHFDSELDHRKRFYRQIPAKGFSFLMNFKDIQNPDMTKVRTATYQSLTVGTVCVDGACDPLTVRVGEHAGFRERIIVGTVVGTCHDHGFVSRTRQRLDVCIFGSKVNSHSGLT